LLVIVCVCGAGCVCDVGMAIVFVCGAGCVCDAGMVGCVCDAGMAGKFGKVVVCVSGRSSRVEVVAGEIGIGLEIEVDVVGGCEWVCELREGIGPNSEG
jgi:hypothetical protein